MRIGVGCSLLILVTIGLGAWTNWRNRTAAANVSPTTRLFPSRVDLLPILLLLTGGLTFPTISSTLSAVSHNVGPICRHHSSPPGFSSGGRAERGDFKRAVFSGRFLAGIETHPDGGAAPFRLHCLLVLLAFRRTCRLDHRRCASCHESGGNRWPCFYALPRRSPSFFPGVAQPGFPSITLQHPVKPRWLLRSAAA